MADASSENQASKRLLRFQILSDLHLESPATRFQITPNAPYLLLLGDIHNQNSYPSNQLLEFLETQLAQFELVFFVFGNHEPYHSSWPSTKASLKAFARSIDNPNGEDAASGKLIILDQTRYDFTDYNLTILGCTLFSHIPEEEKFRVGKRIQDFDGTIENWTIEDHNAAHASDLTWLNEQVTAIAATEPNRKVMILTHHSPTNDSRAEDPLFRKSSIKSAFQTELSGETCWKNSAVKVWACGHTHYNFDFLVEDDSQNQKRMVSNQRGWRAEDEKGFDGGKVIEI